MTHKTRPAHSATPFPSGRPASEAAEGGPRTTPRESGYGILFRNVAASIEATDPGAAQALMRASVDVEEMVEELVQLRADSARHQAFRTDLHDV